MKLSFNKLVLFSGLILLIMLSACKKDGTLVTATTGKAGTLTVSTTTLVLQKASLNDTTKAIKFNFTPANYGYSAVVTNTLQIDKPSDNFANPTSVTVSANALSQGFNTADFNSLLLKLGLAGGVSSTVQVRVMQAISTSVTPVYSNTLTLTVTPFNLTSWLYVVGQFNGYSTAAPDSLLSATTNGIYVGVINFTAGNTRFLILPAKSFASKYATQTSPPTGTSTSLTYATQFLTSGGNDLYAPSTPGYYVITLNTNTNTITVQLTNTYSVIGATAADASGFTLDVPLNKFVNDGVTGWTSTTPIAFRTGDFKIRQNNDWTFSWGIPKSGSEGDGVPNTLNNTSNSNIPVTAGTYAVSFNIVPFALGSSAGASTPPTKTATYKLVKQ